MTTLGSVCNSSGPDPTIVIKASNTGAGVSAIMVSTVRLRWIVPTQGVSGMVPMAISYGPAICRSYEMIRPFACAEEGVVVILKATSRNNRLT